VYVLSEGSLKGFDLSDRMRELWTVTTVRANDLIVAANRLFLVSADRTVVQEVLAAARPRG
jgi:hypothetical protein